MANKKTPFALCIYQVQHKSNPLKLFAVFSATAWNFSMKFYDFTWQSHLHLTAKRHLIIFQYDEDIDILASSTSDFFLRAISVCAETRNRSLKQHTEQLLVWCVLEMFTASFCALFSDNMKLLTASLIRSWGRQTVPATLLWVLWLIWVLDGACDRPPTSHKRHGSSRVRRPWRPLILSDEFWASWPEAISV